MYKNSGKIAHGLIKIHEFISNEKKFFGYLLNLVLLLCGMFLTSLVCFRFFLDFGQITK